MLGLDDKVYFSKKIFDENYKNFVNIIIDIYSYNPKWFFNLPKFKELVQNNIIFLESYIKSLSELGLNIKQFNKDLNKRLIYTYGFTLYDYSKNEDINTGNYENDKSNIILKINEKERKKMN